MVAWIRKFRAESLCAGILALVIGMALREPAVARSRRHLDFRPGYERTKPDRLQPSDLYQAGQKAYRTGAMGLGNATTDLRGGFTIRFFRPATRKLLYLVALGGNGGREIRRSA